MNKDYLNRNDFITLISKKARFSKGDIEIVLDAIVEIFEESVKDSIIIKVRGLGKLYSQTIKPRKGKGGISLPETQRIIFRLSQNIRRAKKRIEKS